MRFAPDARLLIAAERSMCRIGVIAVGPYAPGLNAAPHLIGQIAVAAPDAGAEAILRIVSDFQRLLHGFKGGYRQHWAKDLLLKDAHIVLTKQNGRLKVIALFKFAIQLLASPTGQNIGPLFFTDIDIIEDSLKLAVGDLRPHLCTAI